MNQKKLHTITEKKTQKINKNMALELTDQTIQNHRVR
jgi:hypothetical protein